MEKLHRSPFFYVGDKYKLMPQLRQLFPKNIDTYIEPFVGGGSSFLNINAKKYILNDIDSYIIKLHKYLIKFANDPSKFFKLIEKLIVKFNLSCSFKNISVPKSLKEKYPKTYYSHYNKNAYNEMKTSFNKKQDLTLLYLLLIYGFNHMIRFNSSNNFNLPVGNVDFNKNVYNSLVEYFSFMRQHEVKFYNQDFKKFLHNIEFDINSYVYLDPPYLISGSEYNKYWNEEEEVNLCTYLDELNHKNIRFGITNLVEHKGRENRIFKDWSKKYFVYSISSNYISFNDNSIKYDSKEVFVTNYGRK